MDDKQLSAFINVLRYTKRITPLQKDILDTWDELKKNPFDAESAHKQIVANNYNNPDVFMAISAVPGIVQKTSMKLTHDDMIFTLRRQLEGLVAKEMGLE